MGKVVVQTSQPNAAVGWCLENVGTFDPDGGVNLPFIRYGSGWRIGVQPEDFDHELNRPKKFARWIVTFDDEKDATMFILFGDGNA